MSNLLTTKPRWFPNAVPTNRGWENPQTGEVLVAIGNLKNMLGTSVEQSTPTQPAPVKKAGRPKKVISEVVQEIAPPNSQILGEVVGDGNTDTNKQIIGE